MSLNGIIDYTFSVYYLIVENHSPCVESISTLTPSEVINSICSLSLLLAPSCSGEPLVSMDLTHHCNEISITLNLSILNPQR